MLRATTACTFTTWTGIESSKSGPNPVCFYRFQFQMCLSPQRCARFRHLNFQKWSEAEVFCTFIFTSTFSAWQLPKVLRTCGVLTLSTSKCASRHNGVQLFISHLASWLRTRRFREPTSGATKHRKNTVPRDFPTFSRTCIFSLLTFSISD